MAKRDPYKTLVRVRKRQEDLKAEALGAVRRAIRAAEMHRKAIADQQRHTLEQASDRTRSTFRADDLRRFYLHERHLAELAVQQDAELARLGQEEEDKRFELEEAVKRRRMVERLNERKRMNELAEWRRHEQRLVDEAAVCKALLTQREERRR